MEESRTLVRQFDLLFMPHIVHNKKIILLASPCFTGDLTEFFHVTGSERNIFILAALKNGIIVQTCRPFIVKPVHIRAARVDPHPLKR